MSGVKDTTSSLQDLAALCANAEEVTSPGSPAATGAAGENADDQTCMQAALLCCLLCYLM